MNFPLSDEDIQQITKRTRNECHKILVELICKICNTFYECGKEMLDSGFFWTKENIKEWLEMSSIRMKSDTKTKFIDVVWNHANEAYQQGVRASRKVMDIPVDTVKVYPCFEKYPPKHEKMKRKERYFSETGLLQSQIILDSRGNLIDGYTSYLLAKTHGIQCVPIRYGKRQLVRASHKPGGKLYTWELPGFLIDQVSVGDKVLVHTQSGIRTVTVTTVEDYAGNEPESLRMVIRVKKKVG